MTVHVSLAENNASAKKPLDPLKVGPHGTMLGNQVLQKKNKLLQTISF